MAEQTQLGSHIMPLKMSYQSSFTIYFIEHELAVGQVQPPDQVPLGSSHMVKNITTHLPYCENDEFHLWKLLPGFASMFWPALKPILTQPCPDELQTKCMQSPS